MNMQTCQFAEILPGEYSIAYKSADRCEKTNFHLHDQLEFIYTLSDNLILQTETKSVSLPRHHILLLSCRDLHYLHCEENTGLCSRYNIYFSPKMVSHLSSPEFNILQCFNLHGEGTPNVLRVPPEQQETFMTLLGHMTRLFRRELPAAADMDPKLTEQYTRLLLGQLLVLTNNLFFCQYHAVLSHTVARHQHIAAEIAEYVEANLCDALNTEIISKQFFISKTQLYYLFTEVYGISLSNFISELRITKAKNLLLNSGYSIDYISQAVGYQSLASFSRAFKAKTHFSPQKYRTNNALPSHLVKNSGG